MATTGSGMQEGTLVIANMSACVCVCTGIESPSCCLPCRTPLALARFPGAGGSGRPLLSPPLPWGGRGGFAEAFPEAAPQVWLQELLEAHPSGLATDVLNPLLPVKLFHLLAGGKI